MEFLGLYGKARELVKVEINEKVLVSLVIANLVTIVLSVPMPL